MAIKEHLTQESLKGEFKSTFELAHLAISLAQYYVHSGHEVNLTNLFEQIRRRPSPKLLEEVQLLDKED
ncbi:MAG: hypothetical protein K2Y01_11205 [Rhabdochlamydiaceae bacterium]|nr:hypothetical protein [Rhabdochlamydiaceae bacterium]